MGVEAELFDRVRALQGKTLTVEDTWQFLRQAAELLGGPPLKAVGPRVRFRWLVGERVIQIGVRQAFRSSSFEITVEAFCYENFISNEFSDREWAYQFEGDAPYWWEKEIGDVPSHHQFYPGAPVVRDWEQFDQSIGEILQYLPTDIAVAPPEWWEGLKVFNPENEPLDIVFQYVWNMAEGKSPCLGVVFSASRHGIRIGAARNCRPFDVTIPRRLLESGEVQMTRVVAGFAGPDTTVDEMRFFCASGFDGAYPVTLREGHGPSGAPHKNPLPIDDLVELIAQSEQEQRTPDASSKSRVPKSKKTHRYALAPEQAADYLLAYLRDGEFEQGTQGAGWTVRSDRRRGVEFEVLAESLDDAAPTTSAPTAGEMTSSEYIERLLARLEPESNRAEGVFHVGSDSSVSALLKFDKQGLSVSSWFDGDIRISIDEFDYLCSCQFT